MTLANASLNSLVRCKMRPCLNAGGGRVRIELDSLIEIGNRSIMVAVFITDQAAVTVHAVVVNSAFGIDFAYPTIRLLRADGNLANGWASSAQVEAEVAAWFDAKSPDEEKTIARRLNKACLDHVLYAPLGAMLRNYAWRKNVIGIVPAPGIPLFWGVSKAA